MLSGTYFWKIILLMMIIFPLSIFPKLRGQTISNPGELKYFDPEEAYDDLFVLDRYFEGSKVVGMGESTHGTYEFFKIRHRIFQYLVEHHGFNTFFLEADYGVGLTVDQYINGAGGSSDDAVKVLSMWPWITEEMKELIEWMRAYNATKYNARKLRFIGVDMQRINSTVEELDKIIVKYKPEYTDETILAEIPDNDFFEFKDESQYEDYLRVFAVKKNLANEIDFEEEDKIIYQTLLRHLRQIIESKGPNDFHSYRDKMMGENIVYHMEKDSSTKGFFWAHNGHILNLYKPKKKERKSFYRAGGVLKQHYGDGYLAIGQDFVRGEFNAYRVPEGSQAKANYKTLEGYEIGIVSVTIGKDGLGNKLKDFDHEIMYVDLQKTKEKDMKNLLLHNIGASYNPSVNRGFLFERDMFDIIIVIKNTTATKLVD